MRTLQLTHDEISLIKQALGIAEKQIEESKRHIAQNLIFVRNNDFNGIDDDEMLMPLQDKLRAFSTLNYEIENGNKDV